jgi:thiamine biosynthesis protein ThiI
VKITKAQSTMMIEPQDDTFDFEQGVERVSQVFGVSAFSRACVAEKTFEDICEKALKNRKFCHVSYLATLIDHSLEN